MEVTSFKGINVKELDFLWRKVYDKIVLVKANLIGFKEKQKAPEILF
jgi:hypothetical protein